MLAKYLLASLLSISQISYAQITLNFSDLRNSHSTTITSDSEVIYGGNFHKTDGFGIEPVTFEIGYVYPEINLFSVRIPNMPNLTFGTETNLNGYSGETLQFSREWTELSENFDIRKRSLFGSVNTLTNQVWAKEIDKIDTEGIPVEESFSWNAGGSITVGDTMYVYSLGFVSDSIDLHNIPRPIAIFQTKYTLDGSFIDQACFRPSGIGHLFNILFVRQYKHFQGYNYLVTTNEEFKDGNRYLSTFVMRFDCATNTAEALNLKYAASRYEIALDFDDSNNLLMSIIGTLNLPGSSYTTTEFLIHKINPQFELEWSRYYKAEDFFARNASLHIQNEEVIYSLTTDDNFPVIVAKLDTNNGEIISTEGYPFFTPKITNLSDGRIVVSSNGYYNDTGELQRYFQLSVADNQNQLTDCSPEPACLYSDFLDIDWTPVTMPVIPSTPYDFINLEATVSSIDAPYTEGCNTPEFPQPTFQTPQTLCIQDTLQITNLKNQLANGYQWQLTGPNNYEQQFDNENPENLTLAEPGTYYLRQTIYVLGCAYEYEQLFEVIDEASVASETITVCEFPAKVTLQSNCDSTDIRWDDGSIGSRTVTAPGDYAVTVCSGLCANEFLISVRPADELLPDPLFTLPADTAICPRDFPFFIDAPPDLVTTLNGEPAPLRLDAPGTYRLGYLIDDCLYEQTLTLNAADCTPRLFIPNAFSPNNDGVNDHLELLSNENIELRTLEVYDRWGARIYRQVGGRLRWDGRVEGNLAGAGTYVVRVVYVEVHTGEEVDLAQDVALLR